MNLPQNISAQGKAAFQVLRSDTVTIDREGLPIVNNKKTHYHHTDIKCHLSQTSASTLNQTSTVATTEPIYTLYVDPSVKLVVGDTLTIMHKGQVITGVAGEPFSREFSNSVKVKVNKIS